MNLFPSKYYASVKKIIPHKHRKVLFLVRISYIAIIMVLNYPNDSLWFIPHRFLRGVDWLFIHCEVESRIWTGASLLNGERQWDPKKGRTNPLNLIYHDGVTFLNIIVSGERGVPEFDTKYVEAPQHRVVLSLIWVATLPTTYNKYYLSQRGYFILLIFQVWSGSEITITMVSQEVFG